jgi:uncharacterized integral membrane protein (TIGR00698 family)
MPGLAAAAVGVLGSLLLHRVVGTVGVLTWSVLFGALAANLRVLPARAEEGLRLVAKRLLRVGVVLLGFSLPLTALLQLGSAVLGLVVVTLVTTLLVTIWLGLRMGLGRPRCLLMGTGFAICGASAIAAVEQTADADEEDVAAAVGMVTVWGSVAMIALPLLQVPLGLSEHQLGLWAGASVHEVGQVVAAAGPAGAAAVSVAVAVKLTRVLLLAPVVAAISVLRGRFAAEEPGESASRRRPPLVPLFVLGFLSCAALRSAGVVPGTALSVVEQVQTCALAAGLFALGTAVRLRSLRPGGGSALLVGGLATVTVAGVALPLVVLAT